MKLNEGLNRIRKGDRPEAKINGLLTIENMGTADWALMEDVFDLGQLALWEWDIRRDKIRGTRQLYEIFGTQPGDYDDSLFASLEALVHPEHQRYVQMALKEALRIGTVDRFKFRIVRKDGQDRWLMVKARIKPGGESAVGMITDCSQSQTAELSLYKDLEFLQTLVDAVPNPIFYKDTEGIYRFCNLAFAKVIGTYRENIIGKTVFEIAGIEQAAIYHQKDLELFASGGSQEYETKVQVHIGEERNYHFHKVACNNLRGAPVGLVGVMTDITESAATHARSERLALLKEAMLEVSHSIIGLHDSKDLLEVLLDKAMNAIPASHAGSVLMIDETGYLQMLVSRGYKETDAGAFRLKIEDTYTYRISGGRFEEPFIVNHIAQMVEDGCLKPLQTLDGGMIASNLSTPIRVEGDPVALVIVDSYEDNAFTEYDLELMGYLKVQAELALTNLKLYQDTLRFSRYDHLTGVYNRGYFDKILGDLLDRTMGLPHRFTFVIMDLDGLKTVNDRLGHREGDFRLQAFAAAFQKILGEGDIMGRYGGDEFVAAFFDKEQPSIGQLVDGVMAELSGEPERYCSFSYGSAQFPVDGKTTDDLVRVADRKLYEHKRKKNFNRRQEDSGNQN